MLLGSWTINNTKDLAIVLGMPVIEVFPQIAIRNVTFYPNGINNEVNLQNYYLDNYERAIEPCSLLQVGNKIYRFDRQCSMTFLQLITYLNNLNITFAINPSIIDVNSLSSSEYEDDLDPYAFFSKY